MLSGAYVDSRTHPARTGVARCSSMRDAMHPQTKSRDGWRKTLNAGLKAFGTQAQGSRWWMRGRVIRGRPSGRYGHQDADGDPHSDRLRDNDHRGPSRLPRGDHGHTATRGDRAPVRDTRAHEGVQRRSRGLQDPFGVPSCPHLLPANRHCAGTSQAACPPSRLRGGRRGLCMMGDAHPRGSPASGRYDDRL
jgi:hypothetical protein